MNPIRKVVPTMKQRKTWIVLCSLLALFLLLPLLSVRGDAPDQAQIVSPALNVLAAQSSFQKSALAGKEIVFTTEDIDRAFGMSDIPAITVLSLPPAQDGLLQLGELTVLKNQTILRKDIEKLKFVPRNSTLVQTSFTLCNSGCDMTYNLSCVLSFTDRQNEAPTFSEADAFTLQIKTISDIAVFGRLRGQDPDGDKCTFSLLSYPQKGVVQISDATLGTYCYIPRSQKVGSDSFTYQITDCYGNVSAPITVSVEIEKSNAGILYEDMIGHRSHLAAIALTQAGIMSGSEMGGFSLFDPDRSTDRCEFLVMAMQSAAYPISPSDAALPFTDLASIDEIYLDYVGTALQAGIIEGTQTEDGLCFLPNETLTRAEAAVIVSRLIQAAVPTVVPVFADSHAVPTWAQDALASLCSIGLMETDAYGNINADAIMTRADSAQLLYSLYNYLR